MSETARYIGRFAPSPTGPLHFGSLLAATASYLEARQHNGSWLLRIEDIDPPREERGAAASIAAMLECYGFEWDGPIHYQSASDSYHHEALQALIDGGHAYQCGCSRRDLSTAPRSALGTIYPGTCRAGTDAAETAVRIQTNDDPIQFDDELQGLQSQQLESETGDFVILRRDGLIAYHLAVVVDDHLQGVTDVVRGIDLMDSTPRQIWAQRQLGYLAPRYAHIPVAVNADGSKLSKLTGATGLSCDNANRMLVAALHALRQPIPPDLGEASISDIWAWAMTHWNIDTLRGASAVKIKP